MLQLLSSYARKTPQKWKNSAEGRHQPTTRERRSQFWRGRDGHLENERREWMRAHAAPPLEAIQAPETKPAIIFTYCEAPGAPVPPLSCLLSQRPRHRSHPGQPSSLTIVITYAPLRRTSTVVHSGPGRRCDSLGGRTSGAIGGAAAGACAGAALVLAAEAGVTLTF